MHIEVQVALNFVISYLYNKLPRRRVNIFGEELEKALKEKFQGHWYPEKPYKGSAFRCLKTGDPIDKVLERAARESGVPIQDILENLPQELAVWVDPGEVSYRIGEKGLVKILFSDNIKNNNTNGDNKNNSENNSLQDEEQHALLDREVTKTFNPEAQCFRPIECVTTTINNLSLLSSPKTPTTLTALTTITTSNQSQNTTVASQILQQQNPILQQQNTQIISNNISPSLAPSPTLNNSYKGSPSPVPPPAFIPRTTTPLTFTTATFAQTKFGSTKLKTSSKRANRMSPTEFSNYIKARAMQQQQQQLHHHHQQQPPLGRALSPDYYFHQNQYPHHFPPPPPPRSIFESSNNQYLTPDLYSSSNGRLPYEHSTGGYYPPGPPAGTPAGNTAAPSTPQDNGGKLDNNNWTSYPTGGAGQYQHLLVAN